MILFDTNSTENTQVVAVTSPQELVAYGIGEKDRISVEIALVRRMGPNFSVNGCSIIDMRSRELEIQGAAPYTVCGCPVNAVKRSPRLVISRPGVYLVTFSGPSFGDAIVDMQDASAEAIAEFNASCASICEDYPYCASYPMLDGGYGFIDGDYKDPDATAILEPCPGDVITPTVYLFPTPKPGATAAQKDCDGNVIGYAMNNSECAIVLHNIGTC